MTDDRDQMGDLVQRMAAGLGFENASRLHNKGGFDDFLTTNDDL
jgi:hypothetical protein